ncbi:MAG TPA: hypothetical protein VKX96_13980 [Chloroflexota bacterium]|nr:hypothetical protein [Chloroflexota bacterium]
MAIYGKIEDCAIARPRCSFSSPAWTLSTSIFVPILAFGGAKYLGPATALNRSALS